MKKKQMPNVLIETSEKIEKREVEICDMDDEHILEDTNKVAMGLLFFYAESGEKPSGRIFLSKEGPKPHPFDKNKFTRSLAVTDAGDGLRLIFALRSVFGKKVGMFSTVHFADTVPVDNDPFTLEVDLNIDLSKEVGS